VAELAVVGRPAVLIPLTINDDQRANAAALVKAGGAVVVEQREGAAALSKVLEGLLMEPERLVGMAAAATRMGIVDAAERLADLVEREMVS
jgi:UDP-N-acetylglucosamine--N-acetylmuramyl-(pentapeptide) pyrophosphoryl-undecaprenol N-acetylglucosamine transferase